MFLHPGTQSGGKRKSAGEGNRLVCCFGKEKTMEKGFFVDAGGKGERKKSD